MYLVYMEFDEVISVWSLPANEQVESNFQLSLDFYSHHSFREKTEKGVFPFRLFAFLFQEILRTSSFISSKLFGIVSEIPFNEVEGLIF